MKHHYENEIENLRKLKHKNIVEFIGACVENGQTHIVMEYCDNGRLFDYLHTPEVQISPGTVLEWSHQIACGMAFLHRHNVIHRDLKSPNILINHEFTLKISDFGLSKPKLTDSARLPFAGTISWMAPEVIRLECCSEKVDVWSYGVVLWELLTLKIPYYALEQTSIIYGIGNDSLSLPIPASFPEPFRRLIIDCRMIDSTKRPSFKAIVDILMGGRVKVQKISKDKFKRLQKEWSDECDKFRYTKAFL